MTKRGSLAGRGQRAEGRGQRATSNEERGGRGGRATERSRHSDDALIFHDHIVVFLIFDRLIIQCNDVLLILAANRTVTAHRSRYVDTHVCIILIYYVYMLYSICSSGSQDAIVQLYTYYNSLLLETDWK